MSGYVSSVLVVVLFHEPICSSAVNVAPTIGVPEKVYGSKARLFELMSDEEQKQFYYNSLMIGKFVPTQKRLEYGWFVDGVNLSIEEVIKLENI